jgi:hypothetical protein
MKSKLLKVLDDASELYYLVTIADREDNDTTRKANIPSKYVAINPIKRKSYQFTGDANAVATAWDRKDLSTLCRIVEDGVRGDVDSLLDGTDWAVIIRVCKNRDDIPDTLDVRKTRLEYADLKYPPAPRKRKAEDELPRLERAKGPCFQCKGFESKNGFFEFESRIFCSGKCKWAYLGK